MSLVTASIVDIARFGSNIFGSTTLISGVTQILAAGAAARGVVIRNMTCFAPASGTLSLFVDSAAPVSASDTTKRLIYSTTSPNLDTRVFNMRSLAGHGIWVATTAVNGAIYLNWDQL